MTPRALIRIALAASVAALLASPAPACRASIPAPQRIAALQRGPLFAGTLLVRITSARYTQRARPDWHPWEAQARILRTLRGPRRTGAFTFGRSGSTTACDDLTPVPARGDLWVLYLAPRGRGEIAANLSYPLAAALRADPTLAGRLR